MMRKHKYVVTVSLALILFVLVVSGLMIVRLLNKQESVQVKAEHPVQEKVAVKEEPAKQTEAKTEAEAPVETKTSQPTNPVSNNNTTPPREPLTFKPTNPTPQEGPNYFSVGPIDSAYTVCQYGAAIYIVNGTWVGSRYPATQSFTWRLEVSDGTLSDSGVDTMPAGSSIWHNFPSTPDYPQALGSVVGASDGDRVRLVITSPNYAASSWSAPVPAGSEEACRNSTF